MPATIEKKRETDTRTSVPPLTDPHLTALLLYIDNLQGDDEEGSTAAKYARLLADVDALLSSRPLTSAFEGILDRPSPAETIQRELRQLLEREPEEEDGRMALYAETMDPEDDYEPVTGERRWWQSIVWGSADVGMLYGAILMYRLLKGGAQ